ARLFDREDMKANHSMSQSGTCNSSMRLPRQLSQSILAILLIFFGPELVSQAVWSAVGPAGGDARSFAAVPDQPNHLYMGTTNSWLYESFDRGATWHRLSKLNSSDDLIVDHILVDPANP